MLQLYSLAVVYSYYVELGEEEEASRIRQEDEDHDRQIELGQRQSAVAGPVETSLNALSDCAPYLHVFSFLLAQRHHC